VLVHLHYQGNGCPYEHLNHNYFCALFISKKFPRLLAEREIIAMLTESGISLPNPLQNYSFSRKAQNGFPKTFAVEGRKTGIIMFGIGISFKDNMRQQRTT